MTFFERLETLLIEQNEKRTHLAETIGVKNQSFTDWKKRGTIPAADIAMRIADYFNVSLEWLLTGKEKDGVSHDDILLLEKLHNIHTMNRNAAVTLINALYEQEKHFWDPSPENKD